MIECLSGRMSASYRFRQESSDLGHDEKTALDVPDGGGLEGSFERDPGAEYKD